MYMVVNALHENRIRQRPEIAELQITSIKKEKVNSFDIKNINFL